MDLDIIKNEGTSEKGCVEIEDWGFFFVHFVGVSRKFNLHFTLVLAKILHNGAKFIKKLGPGFKNQRNVNNFLLYRGFI